jgi:ABC-type sugar transport system ATPase subunit
MSSVRLRGVDKSFATASGELQVLFGVDLDVARGSFVALLGPSGCGKSTTLRLIAGLEHADAGEIRIDDRIVNDRPAKERNLGMVFQNYALFPHLDVAQNITFGLQARKVPRAECEQRLRDVAELVGLSEYLDRNPSQVSGGQRQRVALARALVSGASLVLMDEPLSNLDAKLRAEMRQELRELQQRLELTVVYVTHDQVEAMTMADEVAVMREGRIEQVASPRELYRRPASRAVAAFIGAPPMNLLRGRCDGDVVRDGSDRALAVSPGEIGGDVFVGVRAEDVHLAGDNACFGVGASVERLEDLGADVLVTARTRAGDRIVARLPGDTDLSAGTDIEFGWAPNAALVYGAGDTGELLHVDEYRRSKAAHGSGGPSVPNLVHHKENR